MGQISGSYNPNDITYHERIMKYLDIDSNERINI